MKIAIILGTRPEIIKCSPIIRECVKQQLNYFILHTGQHYSYNMDQVFFKQLDLPHPKYNIGVGSGNQGDQTGKMLAKIENVLIREKPTIALVQGDTNTVLAGALAAVKLGIKVGHVEAGLRSYDRRMPEEINRIVADHCSDYLFAPTEKSKKILIHEGIPKKQIFQVGNTIVDATKQNLSISGSKSHIVDNFGLKNQPFILATSHRQENVDNKTRFKGILEGLKMVQSHFAVPLIYPIHPRAKKQLEAFNLETGNLTLVEPVDYLSFLQLESKATLVLTDSGGVQEETCILSVPCVTLRDNTERPETIDVGSNILAGTSPSKILEKAKTMMSKKLSQVTPFGDGTTGKKIISVLLNELK